ncbi:hypothetical protein ALT785_630004 [Alteromonas infernus]
MTAVSLRSDYSRHVYAPYLGVRRHLLTTLKCGFGCDIPASRLFR